MPVEEEGEVFSTILDLEDQYHAEGYALGVSDGAKSGRIEGHIFGLEKGFEKFIELGRLQGRADVWRHDVRVKSNGRLAKHVDRLASLTASEDLSTSNDEDAVNEVEDKMRDAQGKERIIRRALEEEDGSRRKSDRSNVQRRDLRVANHRHTNAASTASSKSTATAEMEDFLGIPTQKRAS